MGREGRRWATQCKCGSLAYFRHTVRAVWEDLSRLYVRMSIGCNRLLAERRVGQVLARQILAECWVILTDYESC